MEEEHSVAYYMCQLHKTIYMTVCVQSALDTGIGFSCPSDTVCVGLGS